MTTKDEALKLALEALEEPKEHIAKHRRLEAITAIKEVLAQPKQKPVAKKHEPTIHPAMDMPHDQKIAFAYGHNPRANGLG